MFLSARNKNISSHYLHNVWFLFNSLTTLLLVFTLFDFMPNSHQLQHTENLSKRSNSSSQFDNDDSDDDGLQLGDVEMTLFRPNPASKFRVLLNSFDPQLHDPTYQRYFSDPLSMFSQLNPSDTISNQQEQSSTTSHEQEQQNTTQNQASSSSSSNSISHDNVNWRERILQSCAHLLQKSIDQLQQEYASTSHLSTTSPAPFTTPTTFDLAPRDLTDYAIIQTLRTRRDVDMKIATSWLFNLMDRTGHRYVFREEFILYTPFIHPVADNAVASIVFDALVRQQVNESNDESLQGVEYNTSSKGEKTHNKSDNQSSSKILSDGVRQRNQSIVSSTKSNESETDNMKTSEHRSKQNQPTTDNHVSPSDSSNQNFYPPGSALGYDMWRRYYEAVQEKYNYADEDWIRVKGEVGIDPREVLIKSQAALDHSDVFPTPGKLFLSQRYLVFFAFVGRNHYVARLGAVAKVTPHPVHWMVRDCVMIHLETETKAALDGISALTREEEMKDSSDSQDLSTPQHRGKLMRRFTAGDKPLLFSSFEFRPAKRRDNWVNLIREMVAAHKLHVQLHFGNSGRAHPSIDPTTTSQQRRNGDNLSSEEGEKDSSKSTLFRMENYTYSPFRDEPAPPLLAIAAHSNIARYRALRRITNKTVSNALLIFSRRENNIEIVDWYADSVRAYNDRKGKSLFERALSIIRENMETNERIYRVQDDEPFDVGKLGDAIGRFAELCSPLVRVIQFINHLTQWRNPPATILAVLTSIWVATKGWVHYIPAALFFFQAVWVVETKFNIFGLGMGRMESEDAERRQANVLAMVSQVSQVCNSLEAAQNALTRMNRELGKFQSLFLWGCEEWQSWVAVGTLSFIGLILLILPSRILALFLFFLLFFKHFLPPMNPGLRFWQTVPSKCESKPNAT